MPEDPIQSGTFFKATGAASRPPAARGKGRTRRRDGFLIDAGTRGRGPAETPLAARSNAGDHMIPSTLPAGNGLPLPHMLVQGNDDEDAIALQSPRKALGLLLSWTHHPEKKTGAPYPFKDEEPGSSEPEIEMHYTEIGIYFNTCPLFVLFVLAH